MSCNRGRIAVDSTNTGVFEHFPLSARFACKAVIPRFESGRAPLDLSCIPPAPVLKRALETRGPASASAITEGPPMIRLTDPADPARRSAISLTLVAAFALAIVPSATADEAGGAVQYLAFVRARAAALRARRAATVARRLDRTPDRDPPSPGPGARAGSRPAPSARSHQPRYARPRRLPRREGDVPDPARGPDDREPLPAGVARPAPGDPGRPRPLARGEAGPGRAGPLHRRGEAGVRRPRGRRLRRRRAGRRQGARRVPWRDDRRDPLAHRPDPRRPPGLRERPGPRLPAPPGPRSTPTASGSPVPAAGATRRCTPSR